MPLNATGLAQDGTIAKRMIRYALNAGIDFGRMASFTGMDEWSYCEIMQGKRSMSAEEFVRACEFLQVSPSTFIPSKE